MKFKPQHVDPVNDSNLCCKGLDKCHKKFKAFFDIQDPQKAPPPKASHPNWKVDPLLAWIQAVSMAAWDMGCYLCCDEQTIGFKGNHADKQWISYQKKGVDFWQM